MALRGTLTHWKTRLLADRLGISPAHALGLLEALWHATAEDAPAGNIGRLSNKAIVMQMFATTIEPDTLIAAFVASGHVDEHPIHRLIVHHWSHHADNHIHAWLARRCLRFADGTIPNSGQLNNYEREQFYAWLEEEGEHRPRTGRPKSPTKTQGEVSGNSGESQVPVPVPVPVPKSSLVVVNDDAHPTVRPEDFADYWNQNRGKLPKVRTFNDDRRKQVIVLMKKGVTLELFKEAVGCCTQKPWLRGDGGWEASFDWLIKKDTHVYRAIEEKWGVKKNAQPEKLDISSKPVARVN